MSLRTSLILLSLAFGVLVAIVVVSFVAGSPAGRLQADLERLRAPHGETKPMPPTLVETPLPDLRDAPRRATPVTRPVGATR